MENKLRDCCEDMVVCKNLQKSNFFSALSLPSFLRDFLLKKFEDEDGEFDIEEISGFIKSYLPGKDDWFGIKDKIVNEGSSVKILAKIAVDINIGTSEIHFSLPDFGLGFKDTIIEPSVWEGIKDNLKSCAENWGVLELAYRYPDEKKAKGAIKLISYKDFCPYTVDLEDYKDLRAEFTTEEWIDVILGAMDYNPAGYKEEFQKFAMIKRLLPFVEKRVNLIELAPKGTGKSYLFGRISKYGWLASGGVMSRAKMFYDMSKKTEGLVGNNDFVALDEVQTIKFSDVDEMRGALKGYMESGKVTVGNHEGTADAGIVLLGNIKQENMNEDKSMFAELPAVFHESALIDRFHGFIRGWDIPRMNDDMKANGWALNSEYFTTILHLLRDDGSYRAIVDELVIVPEGADTRDTEAVKRLCTGFVKLLFPNVRKAGDLNIDEFKQYCLKPACSMRKTIKKQLGILDVEFRGKNIPKFAVAGDITEANAKDSINAEKLEQGETLDGKEEI